MGPRRTADENELPGILAGMRETDGALTEAGANDSSGDLDPATGGDGPIAAPSSPPVALDPTPEEAPTEAPVVYHGPGRNGPDADYSAEDTDEWYVTNWSGYRNYHCKWQGCKFATVSGGRDGQSVVAVMHEHIRGHRAQQVQDAETRLNGSMSSIRRAGLVKPNGDRL